MVKNCLVNSLNKDQNVKLGQGTEPIYKWAHLTAKPKQSPASSFTSQEREWPQANK